MSLSTRRWLRNLDYGWNPERVLTFRVSLPEDRYPDARATAGFWRDLLPALESVPGVETVGATWSLPMMFDPREPYSVAGEAYPDSQAQPVASVRSVFPDYFRALTTPLLLGRAFTTADRIGSPAVAIVNEALAQRHWPGQDPLGKRLRLARSDLEVVGVVRDTLDQGLRPRPMLFLSAFQHAREDMYLTLRTAGPPESVVGSVRAAVARLDPDLAIYRIRSMKNVMRREQGGMAVMAKVMPVVGGIALLLAVVGVYAVMACSASLRTHELGLAWRWAPGEATSSA